MRPGQVLIFPDGENKMKFAAVFFGLVAANFIYQAFTGHSWGVALDRSFFQGVALLAAAIIVSAP